MLLIRDIIGPMFIILISLGACQNLSDMKISYDGDQPKPLEESENIKFKRSWQRWDIQRGPRLYDYILRKPAVINGLACRGGFTLDEHGELYGFNLAEDDTLNGTLIPSGSRFEGQLYKDGTRSGYMIYLSGPSDIQGYRVRDKAGLEDYKVTFYRNGRMFAFKTFEDIEIDGIPCKGGAKKSDILLYPNGQLLSCYLSEQYPSVEGEIMSGSRILVDTAQQVHPFTIDRYFRIMKEIRDRSM